MIRTLSLYTGIGGFDLALKLAELQTKVVLYVEKEPYCQKVLQARIQDGLLDDAPIWPDVFTLPCEQLAGVVDLITAGFPCQPFSVAGRRTGKEDKRNLWPITAETIGKIRPNFVVLENVPGIRGGQPQSNGCLHSWDDRRRRDNRYLVQIIKGWEELLRHRADWDEREGEASFRGYSKSLRRNTEEVSGENICMGCWLDFIAFWARGKDAVGQGSSIFTPETRASYTSVAAILLDRDIASVEGEQTKLDSRGKGVCGCSCHNDESNEHEGADTNGWDDSGTPTVGLREPLGYSATRPPGYVSTILGDLTEMGYDAVWGVVGARDAGAPHRRDRWWCLAYDNRIRTAQRPISLSFRTNAGKIQDGRNQTGAKNSQSHLDNCIGILADTLGVGQLGRNERDGSGEIWEAQPGGLCYRGNMDDANGQGLQDGRAESTCQLPSWPPGPTDADAWREVLRRWPELAPATEETQPSVRGVAHGVSNHRVDRLKALGNAIVPASGALALRLLLDMNLSLSPGRTGAVSSFPPPPAAGGKSGRI